MELDLKDECFKPFRKPDDLPVYIHKDSNHPPHVKKQLPKMISERLSRLSSSRDKFEQSKQIYNDALKQSGYKEKVEFIPPKTENEINERKNKKLRKRNVIWYNPPYNQNVSTNVGKQFLAIIDKHFGKERKDGLHKIFNRKTIKISYSCTKNMKNIFAASNAKKLERNNNERRNNEHMCNCRTLKCPLDGNCVQETVVYQAKVTTSTETKIYIGSTEGSFKDRYYNHRQDFKNVKRRHSTSLSDFIWTQKLKDNANENENEINIKWSILKKCAKYKPGSKKCDLCLSEKLEILRCSYDINVLNRRTELMAKCPHRRKFLLENVK